MITRPGNVAVADTGADHRGTGSAAARGTCGMSWGVVTLLGISREKGGKLAVTMCSLKLRPFDHIIAMQKPCDAVRASVESPIFSIRRLEKKKPPCSVRKRCPRQTTSSRADRPGIPSIMEKRDRPGLARDGSSVRVATRCAKGSAGTANPVQRPSSERHFPGCRRVCPNLRVKGGDACLWHVSSPGGSRAQRAGVRDCAASALTLPLDPPGCGTEVFMGVLAPFPLYHAVLPALDNEPLPALPREDDPPVAAMLFERMTETVHSVSTRWPRRTGFKRYVMTALWPACVGIRDRRPRPAQLAMLAWVLGRVPSRHHPVRPIFADRFGLGAAVRAGGYHGRH